MSSFAGFSAETSAFLAGLEANIERAWFEAHRAEYEAHYLAPALAFITAIGDRLRAIDPAISAIPRVNGSLFRINRDVRFSADKTPYKHHIDLWFWRGEDRKAGTSSFFLRIYSDRMHIGAGIHGFDPKALARFRAAVAGAPGEALAPIVARLEEAGYEVGAEHYKKVPKGVDPDHPRARLLRFNALHAGRELELPAEARSAKLVTLCVGHFRRLAPLHAWLSANL